ncbi:MAG TPA: PTS sugar transporter subunit IIA [Phycisphaerae bacterium]|jgi:mannitol/fructose-specific phosphotransferase system IIA component (Ntr-type)
MKLADFIVKDAIVPELKSMERDSVIRELVQSLADANAISAADVDIVVKAIIDRERVGSTGVGKGVAIPHVKHPNIKKRVCVVGRSTVGVDFAALDQAPVYSVIMLLSSPANPDGHLQAMEKIFRALNDDMFRRFLRQADTRQKIVDLIEEADQANAVR